MSRLTALYLKLDLEIPIFDQELSRKYLQELMLRLASDIYRQDVKVEIHFRQGSLEIWVLIAGSIYVAIGNYGSFRSGVNQIIDDSKVLKNLLISTLRKDGVAEATILEQRRLAATPERVRRLLMRIDRFERQLPELGDDEARARFGRLLKAVQDLTSEMEFSEDINLLRANLSARFQLPLETVPFSYRKSIGSDKRPTFLEPKREKFPYSSGTLLVPRGDR